jgi:hypothetical protein
MFSSTITKEIIWHNLIRKPTRDVFKANIAAGGVKQSAKIMGRAPKNEAESAFVDAVFSKLDLIYNKMPIHLALAPTASEQVTLMETDSTRSVPGLLIEYVFLPDNVLADGFVRLTLNIPDGDGFDGDYKQFWLDMKTAIDSKIGFLAIQVKSSNSWYYKETIRYFRTLLWYRAGQQFY